jgi:hypothetical protein
MLALGGVGHGNDAVDAAHLPYIPGKHALVTLGNSTYPFRHHSYLEFYEGKYWCMWSQGAVIEDHPGQFVDYATSSDGLSWSKPLRLAGPSSRPGFRFIARGFWIRQGRLLALASTDEALDDQGRLRFFGPSLELRSYIWDSSRSTWTDLGTMARDAINNYPPLQLAGLGWGMICRDHQNNIRLYTGGIASPLDWQFREVSPNRFADGAQPEEPVLAVLPDGRILGLFRDNAGSKRIYRSFADPDGTKWTPPERTNFPDARSKIAVQRLSTGSYVVISNANPAGRNPLCLALSRDGITYTHMARLPITSEPNGEVIDVQNASGSYQYPDVLEHGGSVLVSFARNKSSIELVKVSLDEIENLFRKDVNDQ